MPVPKRAGGPGGVAILRPKGFTNNQEAMSVMMRALRETRSIAERTARLEMLDMAKVIAQEQKARAPRETGDLRLMHRRRGACCRHSVSSDASWRPVGLLPYAA